MDPRRRFVGQAILLLLLAWALAAAGFAWARHTAPTAARLSAYVRETRLADLSGEARARALRRLAKRLNALPPEERRQARAERAWQTWFDEMTDPEKADFLAATAPAGFRQMLAAFEELPLERRQRAVDDALKRLREARAADADGPEGEPGSEADTNGPPPLSPELQEKVAAIGLQTFYSQSSAQTKAELAPLLEELQEMMETGGLARRRGGPPR